MNFYMKAQIQNMIRYTKTFQKTLELAALQNDKKIDKDEEKALKEVYKATDKLIKDLDKIIKKYGTGE